MAKSLFAPWALRNLILKNRLIRAATYEGGGDERGIPTNKLKCMYEELAQNDVALIITGFNFISQQGRALQAKQCGIVSDEHVATWADIVKSVHDHGARICMQISHCGRQTRSMATSEDIVAPSSVRCTYFNERPKELSSQEIESIIDEYVMAAVRAEKAGFDGIQLHCAHGYLIHQFLSPYTNRRKDQWGGSLKKRFLFAKNILEKIRAATGPNFLILIKLSAEDQRSLRTADVIEYAKMFDECQCVDGIEISYGTMEFAINIFRGEIPIDVAMKHNPLFTNYPRWIRALWKCFVFPFYRKRIHSFTENYNLSKALEIASQIKTPVILTGGIRSAASMEKILETKIEALSLCRPFICEADFAVKLRNDREYQSRCINCNMCTVMCDSPNFTKCYSVAQRKKG